MSKVIVKSVFLMALCFQSMTMLLGALVDTEGNTATNQTLLGDIDMGVGTLGDLSTFIAPYYLYVSNAAMTAETKISTVAQNGTNFTAFALGKFAETGTVLKANSAVSIFDGGGIPRAWDYLADIWFHIADDSTNYINAVAYEFEDGTRMVGQANFASEATSASFAFALSGGDSGYTAELLILESTNAADHAVSEFARTNVVLNGGPYLTEHQSLQPASNYTDYAVIEMARTNSVLSNGPYVQSATVTNTVRDIVTNTVTIGYTDWVYSGNVTAGTTYTINVTESGANYVFTLYNPSELGSVTTNILHPTRLDFTGVGIIADCTPIIRNVNGLAMYSDVQALETKIDTMDTSYYRVVGITNKNQSVQFVETDANTTSLQILMPESGMTKDWLVYVKALTNLTLVLPPADYWVVNESVTNEIPPLVPTALYFSQIADNTYSIGRQELVPITVLSQRQIENNMIRAKMKKAGMLSRSTKKSNAPSKVLTK